MQYIPPWPIFLGPCGHPSAQKVLDQLDLQKQSTHVPYNYISSLHLIAYKPRPQATLTFSLLHAEKKMVAWELGIRLHMNMSFLTHVALAKA